MTAAVSTAVGLTVFLGVEQSREAMACSHPDCASSIVLPMLPAGRLVTFPPDVVLFRTGPGFAHPMATPPRILDANGAVVAASVKTRAGQNVYAPDAPLPQGDYTLEYDARCLSISRPTAIPTSSPSFGQPSRGVLRFFVSPDLAGAEPMATGTLPVIERGTFADTAYGSGSFVRLGFAPTSEFISYLSLVTDWTVTVDDEPYRAIRAPTFDIANPTTVTIDCIATDFPPQPDSCGYIRAVRSGSHRVRLIPTLTGVTRIPAPAETTVDVTCAAPPSPGADSGAVDVPPASDAGAVDALGPSSVAADASGPETAPADASGPTGAKPTTESGGCTFAGRAPIGAPIFIALMAAAWGLRSRRVRSRARR